MSVFTQQYLAMPTRVRHSAARHPRIDAMRQRDVLRVGAGRAVRPVLARGERRAFLAACLGARHILEARARRGLVLVRLGERSAALVVGRQCLLAACGYVLCDDVAAREVCLLEERLGLLAVHRMLQAHGRIRGKLLGSLYTNPSAARVERQKA
jgi:hypothetical protein